MSRDDMHWPERDAFADLLAAERGIEPPPDSSDRVLGRVLATLAAVPPPDGPMVDGGATVAGETAAAAPASPLGTAGQVATVGEAASAGVSMSMSVGTGVSGAAMTLIGGSVVGALALGAWLVLSPSEDTPPPATPPAATAAPEPEPAPVMAPEVTPPAPVTEPTDPPPAAEPLPPAPRAAEPPPAVRATPRRPRPAPARPKAEPTPAPESPPAVDDALRGELELLGAARRALAADDADGALAALRTHARRFPQGRFDQEREVLTIKVLVNQGRVDDARRRAAAFARRHPDSLHRSTIDALLPPAARPEDP